MKNIKLFIKAIILIAYTIMNTYCSDPSNQSNNSNNNEEIKKADTLNNHDILKVDSISTENEQKSQQIIGIDVSKYQGDIDWYSIKNRGLSFAMAKATEGINYNDPKFNQNRAGIKKAGLIFTAYHFYHSNNDPVKQANNFCNEVVSLGKNDLPAVLDLEDAGFKKGTNNIKYQKDVLLWLKTVEEKTGKQPIIYTGYYFANQHLTDSTFADYKIWLARYSRYEPKIPKLWKGKTWTFWQNTYHYRVKGIIGETDHDIFHGTFEELKELL